MYVESCLKSNTSREFPVAKYIHFPTNMRISSKVFLTESSDLINISIGNITDQVFNSTYSSLSNPIERLWAFTKHCSFNQVELQPAVPGHVINSFVGNRLLLHCGTLMKISKLHCGTLMVISKLHCGTLTKIALLTVINPHESSLTVRQTCFQQEG